MRYTGPKNRLARREGVDLGLKTVGSKAHKNLLKKIAVTPGQQGKSKRRRKMTDYGLQLRQKQKLKRTYGISEKQMKNYFKKGSRKIGNTGDFIIRYLETRLDNVVYRLGFTPTRAMARQLVSHGHIAVNSKKNNIPSYEVKIGDKISFVKVQSLTIPVVASMVAKTDIIIPVYLVRKEEVGELKSYPQREDLSESSNIQSVVEFYSR